MPSQAEAVDHPGRGLDRRRRSTAGAPPRAARPRSGRAACRPRRRARCRRRTSGRRRGRSRGGGAAGACSSSVRTPRDAERTSALNPRRSLTHSAPESTGHMRSSASRTSGRRRSRPRSSFSQPSGGASPRERAGDRRRRHQRADRAVGGRVEAGGAVRPDRRGLVPLDEQVEQPPRHVGPLRVVRPAPALGRVDDAGGVAAREAHPQAVEDELQVARQRTLTVGDRASRSPSPSVRRP